MVWPLLSDIRQMTLCICSRSGSVRKRLQVIPTLMSSCIGAGLNFLAHCQRSRHLHSISLLFRHLFGWQ